MKVYSRTAHTAVTLVKVTCSLVATAGDEWTSKLMWRGYKKDLQQEDLYDVSENNSSANLGDRLERTWGEELTRAKSRGSKPSLLRAIVVCFGPQYTFCGFLLLVMNMVTKIAQPVLLKQIIESFSADGGTSLSDAYIYSAGLVVNNLLMSLLIHHSYLSCSYAGMRARVACCSLVYRKVMRLSKASSVESKVGHLVNLISNDVDRFDIASTLLHYLWIGPLQVILITYILWLYVGYSAFVGMAFIFLQTIPIQSFMSRLNAKMRYKIALKTDERVRVMNEVVSGVQVIKMYVWEKAFSNLVAVVRKAEIQVVRKACYLRGVNMAFEVFTERTSLFCILLSYTLFGNTVTSDKVFSMAQFFNVLNGTLAAWIPQALLTGAESRVAIDRLQKFLLQEERREPGGAHISAREDAGLVGVTIVSGSARWRPHSPVVLNDVTLNVRPGSLCAVIGPVGAGKSSLLNVILRELPLCGGCLEVESEISYASQEPWLFVGSVRQNILFGESYNKRKYDEVVRVCALQRDLELFPYGDKTIVGERGVSLSGGQRARINLARAVYRNAELYLLDDPLSAVDTHVGKHLFDECIRTYLDGKTRILVTHQLQHLKDADMIIILKEGKIQDTGTFEEMLNSGLDFAKLLPQSQGMAEDDVFSSNEQDSQAKKLSVIHNAEACVEEEGANPQEVQEELARSNVKWSTYWSYVKAGAGGMTFMLLVLTITVLSQLATSCVDYWSREWTMMEQKKMQMHYRYDDNVTVLALSRTTLLFDMSTKDALEVYGGLILLCVVLVTARSTLLFTFCIRASVTLHKKMFEKVLRAKMWFFDTNPSGRILNRFSKDMGSVDEQLPQAFLEVVQIFLVMVGILAMILIVNYIMVVPVIILGIVFVAMRAFYIPSAINMKRLERIAKSPVFTHLSASMSGLSTIRSCNAEDASCNKFDNLQDSHTSCWYHFTTCSSAFGLWVDIFTTLFIAVLTFTFLLSPAGVSSADVGLALSQALILTTMVQYGIRQSTNVVSNITSVERILEYTHLDEESALESSPERKPSPEWPDKGCIQFLNLSLKYGETGHPVLHNLSFTILPTQKVGIVGRTGAGKSSLISALYCLTNLEGTILVDGVDIQMIGLHDLRQHISIIPQEPVLFSTSLRDNLDPYHEFSDQQIWAALEEVELKELVGSLDFQVHERGANFSVGQRQLVCLARAILRNNRILVMDEATANVDPYTDSLIQKTIRTKFKHSTVLTIAHRLNTIMDSDMVLVMDAGTIVEMDSPHALLQNKNGRFYSMVEETGPATAQLLHDLAAQAQTTYSPEVSKNL